MRKILTIILVLALMSVLFVGCSDGASGDAEGTADQQSADDQTDVMEPSQDDDQSDTTDSQDQTDEQPSTGALIEPEQLISSEEAAQLLGEAVTDGDKTEQEVVGLKICNYEAQDENSFRFLQISITQQAFMPNDVNTPASLYESTVGAFESEAVEAIGDEAAFATPGLHIMSDGYYISIAAGNSDDEAVRAILLEAGALAVQNLKNLL